MQRLGESRAGFRSLTEAIDTTTAAGRMMMQMVGAFAEFERAMLKERTKVGLDAARQDGRIGGRRPKLSPQQHAEIKKMVSKGGKTAADAARLFKIHPAPFRGYWRGNPARHQGRPRMPTNVDDSVQSDKNARCYSLSASSWDRVCSPREQLNYAFSGRADRECHFQPRSRASAIADQPESRVARPTAIRVAAGPDCGRNGVVVSAADRRGTDDSQLGAIAGGPSWISRRKCPHRSGPDAQFSERHRQLRLALRMSRRGKRPNMGT